MSTLALIHPTDLLGVELRESLDRRRDLWQKLLLFSTSEDEIGSLAETRGAAAMVQKLEDGSLDGVDVAFFSASIDANRSILERLPATTAAVVLCADADPGDGRPIVAGVNLDQASRDTPLLSPHPATVALAHLLYPLLGFEPRLAVATVLQPVSIHGKPGLDEMFEQTRSILSFDTNPPRQVFPIQMVFNVVPSLSPQKHLESQLRTVLGRELPVSIHLVQAGVFHSFGTTLYLELAEDPGLEAVRHALSEHPMNEVVPKPEVLGPIDAAARDEVLIGNVEPVEGCPGRYRLWAVMDNLTCGGALNAIQILEAISCEVTH